MRPGTLPSGAYEIPIVIQDRAFNSDGSLFYPDARSFFDAFGGPYVGDQSSASDISPIWNPEFFGNTIVVNGKTWPYLNVEPRKYRFRILNGSDSRFFVLKANNPALKFTVIGGDGGFLRAPVVLDQLLVGPAERFDVIVDFSVFNPGDQILLQNIVQPPGMPSVSMSAAFVYLSYVQAAVYNALAAIDGGYTPYNSRLWAWPGASRDGRIYSETRLVELRATSATGISAY
ncbi:MAG: hypothetical protein MUC98_06780 [Desulfobacterota bacterium]|nr:hypothetical protein [Thermodesulfobacteriota bacterium]